MSKVRTWLAAVLVSVVGVYAACSETPTQAPDISPAISPEAVAEGGSTSTPTAPTPPDPAFDIVAQPAANNCLDDLFPGSLTCTANDVVIAEATVPPGGPIVCVEGDPVPDFTLAADLQSNSNKVRTDIGVWLALDGGDALTGECQHYYFDPSGTPATGALDDLDGASCSACAGSDDCGDIEAGDFFDDVLLVNPDVPVSGLVCQDTDGDGFLDVGACLAWSVPGNDEICPAPGDDFATGTFPKPGSKCRCEPLRLPIQVKRQATVKVIKNTSPTDDLGRWNLTVTSPSLTGGGSANNVGHLGETTATLEWFQTDEPGANQATVSEAVGTPNAGAAFYTTTYSCTSNKRATVSGSGMSVPTFTDLQNGEAIVCTFLNTRIPVPTVSVSKNANTTFRRSWTWAIEKDVFEGTVSAGVCSSGTSIKNTTLERFIDEDLDACYKVTVTPTSADDQHKVTGTITMVVAGSFPPYSGTATVTDVINPGAISATVDCDGDNVFDITAAGTYTCTYEANLPNGDSRTNNASVSIAWNSNETTNGSPNPATAAVTFSATPTVELDEEIDVFDSWEEGSEFLLPEGGSSPSSAAPGTDMFYFDENVSCVEAGTRVIDNDVRFVSNDTPLQGSASADFSFLCKEPPGRGAVTGTEVDCFDFRDEFFSELAYLDAKEKDGYINNVAPGVFFYWTEATCSGTVTIEQSNDGELSLFEIADGQARSWNASSCNRLGDMTPNFDNTGASISSSGDLILSIKFSTKAVVGEDFDFVPENYSFETKCGSTVIAEDDIDLQ